MKLFINTILLIAVLFIGTIIILESYVSINEDKLCDQVEGEC